MQTSRNLRNSDRNPEKVEKRVLTKRPLVRALKTNVLKQKFSMTYSQKKAEKTNLYRILLAINRIRYRLKLQLQFISNIYEAPLGGGGSEYPLPHEFLA